VRDTGFPFVMSDAAKRFLIAMVLFLAAGAIVGWLYGRADLGLLVAALLALAWQVRELLSFDHGLRTGNFDHFRYGEGIWEQIFSRYRYEHDKAARRKRRLSQLLREIRKSTNAMPDGAVILNADNEIVSSNRAAKSLAGLKRKKDRGHRVDNILRNPKLTRLLHSDDRMLSVEIASPVTDGAWLNCRLVPYGADQKLLLIEDITERKRLRKIRRDFVANASHELRSPLTVMSGYLDAMAEDEELVENWEQPVRQMRGQAQRMTRIVAELMELSRLEGAGLATTEEVVDVGGLLASARKVYSGQADIPTIELELESTARVRGYANEIESVIMNLLANAIRHTPADSRVTLTWRSAPDGADLVVKDLGEGIDEEHIPRLTERFFRVDRGRAREDGGVGLGLAIVKHVLERHEADLFILSALGEGSEFRCHFPARRVVVEPPAATKNSV
jgi:two-component system phosphate regulon sensor histidine kinase PhoR